MLEPMSIETPLSWAIRLLFVAILVAGVVLGFAWMRRLMEVEPEAHVFRATASGGRQWPAIAIGSPGDSVGDRMGAASGYGSSDDDPVLARQRPAANREAAGQSSTMLVPVSPARASSSFSGLEMTAVWPPRSRKPMQASILGAMLPGAKCVPSSR